jgi:hypothetical protein
LPKEISAYGISSASWFLLLSLYYYVFSCLGAVFSTQFHSKLTTLHLILIPSVASLACFIYAVSIRTDSLVLVLAIDFHLNHFVRFILFTTLIFLLWLQLLSIINRTSDVISL